MAEPPSERQPGIGPAKGETTASHGACGLSSMHGIRRNALSAPAAIGLEGIVRHTVRAEPVHAPGDVPALKRRRGGVVVMHDRRRAWPACRGTDHRTRREGGSRIPPAIVATAIAGTAISRAAIAVPVAGARRRPRGTRTTRRRRAAGLYLDDIRSARHARCLDRHGVDGHNRKSGEHHTQNRSRNGLGNFPHSISSMGSRQQLS